MERHLNAIQIDFSSANKMHALICAPWIASELDERDAQAIFVQCNSKNNFFEEISMNFGEMPLAHEKSVYLNSIHQQ